MESIGLQRLFSQRVSPKYHTPEEVVRWMGAMQAQDYGQAVWAIGIRTQNSMLADVELAISERKIVQTWPMRGTIHFVAPEDAHWMLKLLATRLVAADQRRQAQLELDEFILETCRTLFQNALEGGKRLTRGEMMAVLEDNGISTKGQRGYHILWYLAQSGTLCFGPIQEKEQTFVLLDEWVAAPRILEGEEAFAELTERYFVSHGPATVHDLARWAGITVTEAKAALEAVKSKLISETVDKKVYWMSSTEAAQDGEVFLLPGFDEFILGYKDRDAVLAPEHAQKIVPGNNGVFKPTVVVGGQVVGTWKRTVKKNALHIEIAPFEQLAISQEMLEAAAEDYSRFLSTPLMSVTVN
jgi:hypothetical protein